MKEKNPQRFYGQPVSPNAEFFIGTFASIGDEEQEYYVVSHEAGYLCILLRDTFGNFYYGDIIAPNYPGNKPGKEKFPRDIDFNNTEGCASLEELAQIYGPEPTPVERSQKDIEDKPLDEEALARSFATFDANHEASMYLRASIAYRKSTGG